jgi:hypothetical protein
MSAAACMGKKQKRSAIPARNMAVRAAEEVGRMVFTWYNTSIRRDNGAARSRSGPIAYQTMVVVYNGITI